MSSQTIRGIATIVAVVTGIALVRPSIAHALDADAIYDAAIDGSMTDGAVTMPPDSATDATSGAPDASMSVLAGGPCGVQPRAPGRGRSIDLRVIFVIAASLVSLEVSPRRPRRRSPRRW